MSYADIVSTNKGVTPFVDPAWARAREKNHPDYGWGGLMKTWAHSPSISAKETTLTIDLLKHTLQKTGELNLWLITALDQPLQLNPSGPTTTESPHNSGHDGPRHYSKHHSRNTSQLDSGNQQQGQHCNTKQGNNKPGSMSYSNHH